VKGFQSPEAEGSFEVITDDITVNMDGGVGGSWKVNETEEEPTKGNATPEKGWRTINALSE